MASEQTGLPGVLEGLSLFLGPLLLRLALPQQGLERGLTRLLDRRAGLQLRGRRPAHQQLVVGESGRLAVDVALDVRLLQPVTGLAHGGEPVRAVRADDDEQGAGVVDVLSGGEPVGLVLGGVAFCLASPSPKSTSPPWTR
ncbi:hypothetical protein [Streptomyces bobili]|uniref:Uncharacterized protein n=1 Tax=Streptomyces bobili TaxID=67280 RepID=A0ABZ1R5Q6_9ACTN|nr:hypothetical protein [Streptomyces bobili]